MLLPEVVLNAAADRTLRNGRVVAVDGLFDHALGVNEHSLRRLPFAPQRLAEARRGRFEIAHAVAPLVRLKQCSPELLAGLEKRMFVLAFRRLRFHFNGIREWVMTKVARIVPRVLRMIGLRIAVVSVVVACTVPRSGTSPSTSPPPNTQPANTALSAVSEEIVVRTNDERRTAGAPALARSSALMRAAQIQADQMAASGTMAHELPGAGYPTLGSRLTAVGYSMSAAGENIAEGQPTAASVVAGWMKSPGHRANILDTRFSEMGAAVAKSKSGRPFYVQVFARPFAKSSR